LLKRQTAEEVLPRAARECYKWLLCPLQETPTEAKPEVEAFPVNTTGGSVGKEMERVCVENGGSFCQVETDGAVR